MTDTFTSQLLGSTSPWNDLNGFWNAYNVAIGSMFETVFGIVSDQGNPDEPLIGTLSAPLSTSAPITTLSTTGLSIALTADAEVIVASGATYQTFTTSAAAIAGAPTIMVDSQTPNFAYPAGSTISLGYVPGWSNLLDPNNVPDQFLPFLAQFNGTMVPLGTVPSVARQTILQEAGSNRGTLAAVRSAVTRNLTGTQSCIILERTPDPYYFLVVVRPGESPNLAAITNAVNAVKPAGVFFTIIQTDGWTIAQMELAYATITALETPVPPGFSTVTHFEGDAPG